MTFIKVWKFKTPVLHINLDMYTCIAFLNQWVFELILSLIQFSEDFKVSNGGPLIRKISVKINRCVFEMKA